MIDPVKKLTDVAAGGAVSVWLGSLAAHFQTAVQIGAAIATIVMCICAARLSTLRRRELERQIRREEYAAARAAEKKDP